MNVVVRIDKAFLSQYFKQGLSISKNNKKKLSLC